MSWTCNGVPTDGQGNYQPHEPYENPDNAKFCFKCELPKSSIVNSRSTTMNNQNGFVLGLLLIALSSLGVTIWSTKTKDPEPTPTLSPEITDSPNSPSSTSEPSSNPSPEVTDSPIPTSEIPVYSRTIKEVSNVPQMTVQYGGSTSFAPLRSPEIVSQIEKAHPKFRLKYREPIPPETPGSGEGIRMLIAGEISVAQSSRTVKDKEFTQAKERGFTLKPIPVALDGIAIYVHPDLSVPSLTIEQLKDIFTGEITSWADLGGQDIPIVPVSRNPEDGGTPEYFREKVLAKEEFGRSVQPYARDTTISIQKVARNTGGIGYATASEVCNQDTIKSLPIAASTEQTPVSPCKGKVPDLDVFLGEEYPITRRLFVVIRQDGTLDEEAGIAYANILLSDEGQELVQQAGMVPLRIP